MKVATLVMGKESAVAVIDRPGIKETRTLPLVSRASIRHQRAISFGVYDPFHPLCNQFIEFSSNTKAGPFLSFKMLFTKFSTALALGLTTFASAAPTVPMSEDLENPRYPEFGHNKRVPPPESVSDWDLPFDGTPTQPNDKRVPPPEDLDEYESPPFSPYAKRVPPPKMCKESDLPCPHTPTEPHDPKHRVPPPGMIHHPGGSYNATPTRTVERRGPPPPPKMSVQPVPWPIRNETPHEPIYTLPVEHELPHDGKGRHE